MMRNSLAFLLLIAGIVGCTTLPQGLPTASNAVTSQSAQREGGPHLFVSEEFDVYGSIVRIAAFPIVNGIVQTKADAIYKAGTPPIAAVRSDGDLYVQSASLKPVIATVQPENGRTLSTLTIGNAIATTAIGYDPRGRLYVGYAPANLNGHAGVVIYPSRAEGKAHPIFRIQYPKHDGVYGIAVLGNELYVSVDLGQVAGQIDVYSPLDRPKLVRSITGIAGAQGIAFGSEGELYVCASGKGSVLALNPKQSGRVKPDRTITIEGRTLCAPGSQPGIDYVGAVAIAGTELFASATSANNIVELDATKGGVQQPLARLPLHEGQNNPNPWEAIDIAVGPR